jgi:F0F1-type ATP synthase assembly protein I
MHEHKEVGCCHHDHVHEQHGHGTQSRSLWVTAAHATKHCMIGCVIGEVLGLFIGVYFQLGVWPTMILATVLAYVIGFGLAVNGVMKSEQLSFIQSARAIWLGEFVSIGVMEIAMNAMDYHVGGVGASSLASPIFYIGMAAAIPAGFLAAWPVNYLLLKHEIKGKCH